MRPLNRHIVCILALGLALAGAAGAQERFGSAPGSAFALFRPTAQPPWHLPSSSTLHTYPPTYYVEGAVVGAGVLATTGAWLGAGLCDSADCTGATVTFALLTGVVGGVAGALVGGAFTAPHPRPLRGRPAKAALVGTVAGAMWGFGLFTHFCLNGCNPSEVRFGISTAAVGAIAGLLVGL
jgi:hypothetical protein